MTRWRYAAATDTGLVRESNQDAIFVDDSLAIVADGMGGHAAGEVASALTVDVIYDGYLKNPTVEGLYEAVQGANHAVLSEARSTPDHFGMGTTVIVLGLTHDGAGVISPTLFHVGDSRAYQLRDGALRQLSDDHSVAEEWVRMGRLTPDEAATHPRRHQLTRGVGVEDSIDIDVMSVSATVGDRVLLCSDGLSNELSNEEIARLASSPISLDEAVTNLITAAKHAGGRDNISVVLLEFDEVEVATTPIKKTLVAPAPPVAQSTKSVYTRSRRRRFTWRVWLGVGFFVAIVAGFFAVVLWYAYSTYYLANDNGSIAVYQGQPKGVLWYKPVKILDTPYLSRQLRTTDQIALGATISEPSLEAAINYAGSMHDAWQLGQSTTTTTSTSIPATTTTVRATTTTAKTG
ncbi:MAG: PP2C family protein-serine/threonine phosphatase [Acidimicrobiales bacterium]